jgi:hypothetical protein
MAIILNSENFFIDYILDIILVFFLGSILLFYSNTIKKDSRLFMLYLSLFIISVNIYTIIYLHHNITKKLKENNSYNILVFLQIYSIILLAFLSGLFYHYNTN